MDARGKPIQNRKNFPNGFARFVMNAIGPHPRGRTSPRGRRSSSRITLNTCQIWLFRKGSRLKSNSFLDGDVKQHNISMF